MIEEYADYYLTEDGLYFRMFGGSRAPSLLPKYATDYIIHKEEVRQVFLDGIGSFLFEHRRLHILRWLSSLGVVSLLW